jgi:hypothetical protein
VNLEDHVTKMLALDIVKAVRCEVPNSEGKGQSHDWSDPYRQWGLLRWRWKIWYPYRKTMKMCLRCGYEARKLR